MPRAVFGRSATFRALKVSPSQGNSDRLRRGYKAVSKEITEVRVEVIVFPSDIREAVFHVVNVWKMPLRMLLRLVLELSVKTWKNLEYMEQLTVNV